VPLLAVIIAGCQTKNEHPNKFSDPVLVKIADLKDRRLGDSLFSYLNHENAIYRQEAVIAFGSLQHTSDIDRIGKLLLMDANDSVRRSAAFALGQIQHPACERILLGALMKEKVATNVSEILNAYGKTTSRWQLDPAAFLTDSLKTAGLAWSLYRAGLRGKTDENANAVATGLLDPGYPLPARLGAAHYFSRGAKDFSRAAPALIKAASSDGSAAVRMAAALALAKVSSDTVLAALKEIIKSDSDPRVVVNALKAMAAFPYGQIKHYLYEALQNKDHNVNVAASEVIIEAISEDDWIEVSSLTDQVESWRIRANLYEAALKAGRNTDLSKEIISRYKSSDNPYARAAYLGALKHFSPVHDFVAQELRGADTAVVRSAAAATLAAMAADKKMTPALKSTFATRFKEIMQSGSDPAVLGVIASALADSTLGYRELLRDPAFLYNAREKLSLPQDIESLQSIDAAIAHFERKQPPTTAAADFNHPIDWDLVRKIPQGQLVTIKTSRGNLVIKLFVNESPGSVANFVTLAQQNYFDGKVIHRVVPNFVVQDGCKRGDGWGSEAYTIRSEFSPRRYTTGTVGMASAGKDTEGTQWFITHSPTPHLDGRYTIFAEVVEGQAVVDYLQVGDRVFDVVIGNFTAQ